MRSTPPSKIDYLSTCLHLPALVPSPGLLEPSTGFSAGGALPSSPCSAAAGSSSAKYPAAVSSAVQDNDCSASERRSVSSASERSRLASTNLDCSLLDSVTVSRPGRLPAPPRLPRRGLDNRTASPRPAELRAPRTSVSPDPTAISLLTVSPSFSCTSCSDSGADAP